MASVISAQFHSVNPVFIKAGGKQEIMVLQAPTIKKVTDAQSDQPRRQTTGVDCFEMEGQQKVLVIE